MLSAPVRSAERRQRENMLPRNVFVDLGQGAPWGTGFQAVDVGQV